MTFVNKVSSYLYWYFWRIIFRIPGLSWLLSWINPLHTAQRALLKAIEQKKIYVRGRVLDLGCGDKPYREIFNQVNYWIGFDLPCNKKADVCGNGLNLPFADKTFNSVICTQVLEHVPEPLSLMRDIFRVLKSGGYLVLTTPQTWGLHLEPNDYYRFTKHGLRYLAEKSNFEVVEISPTCGLWATLSQRMVDTIIGTYISSTPFIKKIVSIFLAPIQLIGFCIDTLIGKQGDTLDNILVAWRPHGL